MKNQTEQQSYNERFEEEYASETFRVQLTKLYYNAIGLLNSKSPSSPSASAVAHAMAAWAAGITSRKEIEQVAQQVIDNAACSLLRDIPPSSQAILRSSCCDPANFRVCPICENIVENLSGGFLYHFKNCSPVSLSSNFRRLNRKNNKIIKFN